MNKKCDKVKKFLKGLGTILLYFLINLIVAYSFQDYMYSDNIIMASFFQVIAYLIFLIVLGFVYRKRLIDDFKNFKKDYIRVALKNWIIGLGIMLIANIIISNFGGLATNEEANRTVLQAYPISSIISMVIIGPLVEEITFRASFKKAFDKWYTFALVTALLFGTAHIQNYFITFNIHELLYLLPYSSLGFFFAKAFYETNNIYTSYIAHVIHNGMCVLLLLILFNIGV